MNTQQEDTELDYYRAVEHANIFSQRTDPRKLIAEIVDSLQGIERDAYGQIIVDTTVDGKKINLEYKWMNSEGIKAVRSILLTHITGFTSLSKYESEDRVNQHVKHNIARKLIIWIAKNKKRYHIKDKNIVLSSMEKPIVEQMYRAIGGFEAELTSKAFQVSEIIDHNEKKGWGLWGRNKNQRGGDGYG